MLAMLIDTHAHLDYPDFQNDLPAVIEAARLAGVTRIISIGTGVESSRRAVAVGWQAWEVWRGLPVSVRFLTLHLA